MQAMARTRTQADRMERVNVTTVPKSPLSIKLPTLFLAYSFHNFSWTKLNPGKLQLKPLLPPVLARLAGVGGCPGCRGRDKEFSDETWHPDNYNGPSRWKKCLIFLHHNSSLFTVQNFLRCWVKFFLQCLNETPCLRFDQSNLDEINLPDSFFAIGSFKSFN